MEWKRKIKINATKSESSQAASSWHKAKLENGLKEEDWNQFVKLAFGSSTVRFNPRKGLFCNTAQGFAFISKDRKRMSHQVPFAATTWTIARKAYKRGLEQRHFLVALLDLKVHLAFLLVHNLHRTHSACNPKHHPNNLWMCSRSQHPQNHAALSNALLYTSNACKLAGNKHFWQNL